MNKLDILSTFKTELRKRKGTRYAVFGTYGETYPSLRNVIIRDLKDNKIFIYTHGRSQKVEHIKENPNSSICWYSHKIGLQLQFYGKSRICDDEKIKVEKSKVRNFKDYIGLKPGSVYANNNEELYFSVIEFKIEKLIALKLEPDENVKFEFDFVSESHEGIRLIP